MPDLDNFRKYCVPGWRKASRLSMNPNSDMEFADACVSASARTLRESGECRGLTEIATIIEKFELETKSFPLFMSGDGVNLTGVFEQFRKIEREQSGHLLTKLTVKAAKSILVEEIQESGLVINSNPLTRLTEKICVEIIDHNLFGRRRNYIVKKRFNGDFDKENTWEQQEKSIIMPSLKKLASQLVKNTDLQFVRAPKHLGKKKLTNELLNEPFE
jgi:hypothetical protein